MQEKLARVSMSWIAVLPEPSVLQDGPTTLALLHAVRRFTLVSCCFHLSCTSKWLVPMCSLFSGRIAKSTNPDSQMAIENASGDSELYCLIDGPHQSRLLYVVLRSPMDMDKELLARILLRLSCQYLGL